MNTHRRLPRVVLIASVVALGATTIAFAQSRRKYPMTDHPIGSELVDRVTPTEVRGMLNYMAADARGAILPNSLDGRAQYIINARREPSEPERHAEWDERMGWHFTWVSSGGNDFNRDYYFYFTPEELAAKSAYFNYTMQNPGPADREGHSVFAKGADGEVYHTYSCYDRGNDNLNIHYAYLDMVPKGRDEGGRGPFWVKRRGEY